jgi:uncharacterized BrkB/YihY/UPF0761 family membrane protein
MMQNEDQFEKKPLDVRAVVGMALLIPAILWWSAFGMMAAALAGLTRYINSNKMQLLILFVFPLASILISVFWVRSSRKRWVIAATGAMLASIAFVVASMNS